jgi:hypothetical protein
MCVWGGGKRPGGEVKERKEREGRRNLEHDARMRKVMRDWRTKGSLVRKGDRKERVRR